MSTAASRGRGAPARYERVDALRGLAMVWMTGFHLCFDLSHFGYWPQDFLGDPVWTLQRTAIVSLFLLCAGLGQAVAWQRGVSRRRFAWRWWQIAGCAALVSAGSFAMFPGSFIYFGVLHGMAVMLLAARCTAHWRERWLVLAALVALALPYLAQAMPSGPWEEAFNGHALNWLGLVTRKPVTEDYVPMFPWLGVVWVGLALGKRLLAAPAGPLDGRLPPGGAALAWLGRHSLGYYMLHQPVMVGALMLWATLTR